MMIFSFMILLFDKMLNLNVILIRSVKNEFYSIFTIKNIKNMKVYHNLDVTSKISNIMFFTS